MAPVYIVNNFRQGRRAKRAKMRLAFVVFVVYNIAGHLAPIELRILVSSVLWWPNFPRFYGLFRENRIVSRAPIVRREISGCRVLSRRLLLTRIRVL